MCIIAAIILIICFALFALRMSSSNPLGLRDNVALLSGPLLVGGKEFQIKTECRTEENGGYRWGRRKIPTYHVLSLPCPTYSLFAFSTQNDWHSFLKNIGLCHEAQTGDPRLDAVLFTECDDDEFIHTLFGMENLKSSLYEIVRLPIKEVWHDGSHLKARILVEAPQDTLQKAASCLAPIATALEKLPQRDLNLMQKFLLYPHFQIRLFSVLLFGLSLGVAIPASYSNILDTSGFLSICSLAFCASLAVLLFLIIITLKGSSHIAKEIIYVGGLSFLTAGALSLGGISTVNAGLDNSPRVFTETLLISKSGCVEKKRRRSGNTYRTPCYLHTTEYKSGLSNRFQVEPAEFQAAQPLRTRVEFYQRDGFFGITWFDEMRISL